ncbi:glycosyltransferase [Autumnicola musiva]|uniref:Glycosyltransferase n=1 Tax=Autumnicola musiva TaxID=3075589 RepID=A0ABU3D7F6_9FLAO|nr:glycosyltransferase [Zunongwangia sp. F117]MDT0677467.1 glycosyltransferase [Zunongwangia sp. F117]
MQKIKVLHIIKSLGRGGAEVLLAETLKLHDQSQFDFHCIYFLPWKDQMVEDIENAGGRVSCFSSNNNLQMLVQYKKVIKYCKEEKIDIIHCHLPWSGFLGRMIYAQTEIPVIYTEHNIQEHYHKITKRLNKLSFNFQSRAIGVSADVTRSIKENINPHIPVETILNGVNTEAYCRDKDKGNAIRKKYGIPLNATVIGSIAVFRVQKSIPDWIKAFKKASDKHPDIYGIVVGAGPQKEEVEQMVQDLDLIDKVILPGLQTNTVDYFSAMDIYMMSSTFEGLPVALLEAMSMKCAIISTRAGGVVEVVRDNEDGKLSDVGDYEDLANHIDFFAADRSQIYKFQNAARQRVKEAFSLQNMVNSLEATYQKHINS